MDFGQLRKEMVEAQIKGRGITDPRLLKAFLSLPRELFIPLPYRDMAYWDGPVDIGAGQTISQPYIVAFMTNLLALRGGEKVLEVGTGSGYQAAIVSRLAKQVFTIERIKSLADGAKGCFKNLGITNVKVAVGDGSSGLREEAPFDAILVTAAARSVPAALKEQLKLGGRLVAPVGGALSQNLICLTRLGKAEYRKENFGGVRFVPLINAKAQHEIS